MMLPFARRGGSDLMLVQRALKQNREIARGRRVSARHH